MDKPVLLIMTSGFPRFKNEGLNQFMLDYAESMQNHFNVTVLAPKDKQSRKEEKWGELQVYRHTQSPFGMLNIAYGNGILPNIRKNPLRIIGIPFFIINQVISLNKLLKQINPEFIVVHWLIPQGIAVSILSVLRSKFPTVIYTAHGSDFWQLNKPTFKWIRNFICRSIDKLIVVSKSMLVPAKKSFTNMVNYVPMGVNVEVFSPGNIDRSKTEGYPQILFVGNIIHDKGIMRLVKSLPLLIRHFPNVKLRIVGEGPLEMEIKSYRTENNLENNLELIGMKPNNELPELYRKSHLFCLPSESEGFPMVLKEALSCGCHCLVSDLPAYKDDKTLREQLIIIDQNNSKEISESIIKAEQDHDLLSINKKGRNYILENGDWNALSKQLYSILIEKK